MSKFIIRPDKDILAMLKSKGFTSYLIRRDKMLGESTMQKFRDGKLPSWAEFAKLIDLLHVSPAAIIAWQRDDGVIFDLTGHRLSSPAPVVTVHHSHPGYDDLPDDFWTGDQDDPE